MKEPNQTHDNKKTMKEPGVNKVPLQCHSKQLLTQSPEVYHNYLRTRSLPTKICSFNQFWNELPWNCRKAHQKKEGYSAEWYHSGICYNYTSYLPQIACDDSFLLILRNKSSSLWYWEAKRGEIWLKMSSSIPIPPTQRNRHIRGAFLSPLSQ